jgi:nucleoid DNA-binding protein
MDIREIICRAKENTPELAEGMSDSAAAALLSDAFKQVSEAIEATDDGMIKVPGLGQFQIRQAERERDGQSRAVRRVTFRPEARKRLRKPEATSNES